MARTTPSVAQPLVNPQPNYDNNLWNRLCADGVGAGSCPPTYQPPETYKGMGAFDLADRLGLYFGGQKTGSVQSNQLWSWNGTGWNLSSPFVPAGGISARSNGSFVWDTNDSVGLLFGGYNSSRLSCLTETWELLPIALSGVNFQWVNITSTAGTPPPGGCGGEMTDFPTTTNHSGYVLYFGGKSYGNHYFNATWEFFSGTWHNVTGSLPFPQPGRRSEGGIAYDPTHDLAVMTGGLGPTGLLNDTWKWAKSAGNYRWTTLWANGSTNSSAGPKASMSFGLTFDSNTQVIYYTGGATGNLNTGQVLKPFRDTWFISNGVWHNATGGISTRSAAAGTNQPLPTFGATFYNYPIGPYSLFQGGKYTSGIANWTYQLTLLLLPTLEVSNSEVAVGNTITFWGNATGSGSATAARSWSGLPTGCAAGNVTTFTCTPTTAGLYVTQFNITGAAVGSGTTVKTISIRVDPFATLASTVTASANIASKPNVTGFWAFDYRCTVSNQPACISYIDQTPVHTFRVAGSMEGYNATSGVEYSRFGGTTSVNWNWPALIQLCQQVPQPCYLDAAVPTQNNDTGLTFADIKYVLNNYSYSPAIWSLGNEPQGWVHFNGPFSATPYPTPYNRITNPSYAIPLGYMENRIAGAVLKAEPNAQIITIQSAVCANSYNFINYTALFTYQNDHTILACHSYPGGAGPTDATPATFLSTTIVQQTTNFVVQTRSALNSMCGKPCATLPFWVTELNGGTNGGTNAKWLAQWPDATFYAAQAAQFLSNNVTQLQPFFLGCGPAAAYTLLGPNCAPTAASNMWTNIFDHLRIGTIYNLSFAGGPSGLYGVKGTNATGTSIYTVNANTSVSATLATSNVVLPAGTATVFTGSPNGGWVETNYTVGTLPSSWVLPPMGVLLINVLNPGSSHGGGGGSNTFPVTLALVAHGIGAVTLSWNIPPTTTQIVVWGGTSCTHLAPLWSGLAYSVTIKGLPVTGSYCFQVVSYNSATGVTGSSNFLQVLLSPIGTLPASFFAPTIQLLLIAGAVAAAFFAAIAFFRRFFRIGGVLVAVAIGLVAASIWALPFL